MKYWVLFTLLALFACIGGVSAWEETFQGATNFSYSSSIPGWGYYTSPHSLTPFLSQSNTSEDWYFGYSESWAGSCTANCGGDALVLINPLSKYSADNFEFTLKSFYPGPTQFSSEMKLYFYDYDGHYVGNTIDLASIFVNNIGGRFSFKRNANSGGILLYVNGVVQNSGYVVATTTTRPAIYGLYSYSVHGYYQTPGFSITIDDIIQETTTSSRIVGTIPHSWYIKNDILGQTVNGLYNQYGDSVRTTYFNTTYGSDTSLDTTLQLVDITTGSTWESVPISGYAGTATFNLTHFTESKAPFGQYKIRIGNTADWDTLWYIGTGASIAWDKNTYVTGSTAKIDYNISSSYYDTSTYSYKIAVMNLYGEYLGTNTTITEPSGSISKILDSTIFTTGAYYAEIIATSKSTGSEILMNYDMMEVTEYVYLSGYVVNQDNVALQGASVNVTQGTSTLISVSNASGYFSSSNNWLSGSQINMTTNLSGYTNDYAVFSPLAADVISRNITLVNLTPTYSGVAIGGVVKDNQYYSTIPGATVYERINGSSAAPAITTANAAAYYRFDNLVNGTVYDVWSSKAGYANSTTELKLAVGV